MLLLSAAVSLGGCGWKMAEMPIRVKGQVLEADTGKPVEGATIDIADEREKLEHVLSTDVHTDNRGKFDADYLHSYEKWMWLGIPVFWFKNTPEWLYVETSKQGYLPRVKQIDCAALEKEAGKSPSSVTVEPILLQKNIAASKSRRRREE